MRICYVVVTFLIILLFVAIDSTAQGINCASIEPFCAGSQELIFANCSSSNTDCNASAEIGPDYGCLSSQPFPAWFFYQVEDAGRLDFEIIQNTSFDANGNPDGMPLDVDFISWGPFDANTNLCDYDLLQPVNEVACSFSPQPNEFFSIANANPGEIYILLITNFDEQPGFIKLRQVNNGNSNAGSTDCSILSNVSACQGENETLDAFNSMTTNYLWEYDDGNGFVTIFDGDFPMIDVEDTGFYQVTYTINGMQENGPEFDVIFYEQPEANPAMNFDDCFGQNQQQEFNLRLNDPNILGSQDPNDFTVEYFRSQQSANDELDVIIDPENYSLQGTSEIIFARIENRGIGNCFDTTSFRIGAFQFDIGDLIDLTKCNSNRPGGESFNLTENEQIALGSLDAGDYTVSYHLTQQDADDDIPIMGDNTDYGNIDNPQEIFVRVEDNSDSRCFDTGSFLLIVRSLPDRLLADVEEAFQEDGLYQVVLRPVDENGQQLDVDEYSFQIDDGPIQDSNIFNDLRAGSYNGFAIDKMSCGVVQVAFSIIDFPRFFTPNGDGFNDKWNITEIGIQPASKIFIFDRYGKLLKQLNPLDEGWDGTFNGKSMPSNDYWFTVEYVETNDGTMRTFKSHFTLKR